MEKHFVASIVRMHQVSWRSVRVGEVITTPVATGTLPYRHAAEAGKSLKSKMA